MTTGDVDRLAGQLGRLLTRTNRSALYAAVTVGVDGVSPTTYPVISGLARIGPTTVTRLADAIGMDRTVVTKYVAALVDAGLLSRSTTAADRRSVELALTDAGTASVATMRGKLHDVLAEATDSWPDADVARLGELLERLLDAVVKT